MQDQIRDIDRVLDIQEYANLIIEHRGKITEEEFYNSRVNQFGLLKMLETIGEAAYKISKATRAEFANLEWEKMIKARHVYVHDYRDIDWNKVWISLTTIDFEKIFEETGKIVEVLKNRFSL